MLYSAVKSDIVSLYVNCVSTAVMYNVLSYKKGKKYAIEDFSLSQQLNRALSNFCIT